MTAAVNLEPVGLKSLPIFSRGHADCSKCELQKQCDKGAMAHAYRPDVFNGIMIVGEGPGGNEVAQNEPFVGRSGQLLRALLETAGIDREQCYITNATLCQPPAGEKKKDKGLHESFPHAIYSCLPRLEAEIEAVRPRVIIALGGAALIALTGYEEIKSKRIPFECPTCDPKTRRLGPVIQCTAKMHDKTPCGWYLHLPTAEQIESQRPEKCPRCTAKLKNQKVKQIKCPSCHGLKTKEQQVSSFTYDYKISEVAGAVFKAEKTDARWDAFGVRFIIPTYHPSFAMRKGEGKGMTGQYVAEPMIKHFQKAHRLLTNEPTWDMRYRVTKDPKVVYEYVAGQKFNFAIDIETEAWGLDEDAEEDIDKLVQLDARKKWKVTAIKCVGIGALELGEMLVVDTRDASDELIDVLADFLEDESVPKTLQNGPYDTVVIRRLWGIHTKNYADDTLLGHHALYPDERHDLAHLAFSFTDAEAWKPPKKIKGAEKHESFEDLCLYNARDVYNTLLSREGMGVSGGKAVIGGLAHREKVNKAYEIDMVMQRIAIDMTLAGMPIDKEALNRVGVEAQLKADKALYQMRAFLNDPQFNPDSPRQVGFVLFDQMGPLRLIPTAYTETGLPSTAADELAKLSSEPFVQHLLAYRAADKTVSTYATGEAWECGIDGRIHPEWKVQGARTGRWSSASPNFQNIPKWIRSCVVAPPGRSFVGADYCLAPSTRVLTADLRWVSVDSLQLGDELVGFPEDLRARHHTYEPSFVVSKKTITRPCYRVTTDRGTVTASAEHLFVVSRRRGVAGHRQWLAVDNLRVGDEIAFLTEPWAYDTTREGGYMAGILDGEGWVSSTPGRGAIVGIGQKPGAVLDYVCETLREKGFQLSMGINKQGVARVYGTGGGAHMRMLGMFRPRRLMQNCDNGRAVWRGRRTWSKTQTPAKILQIENIGEQEVIALGTSTRTLIAEGFLSHNCQLELRIMAALSGDVELIKRCRDAVEERKLEVEFDPHSYVASLAFGTAFTAKLLKDPAHVKTQPGEDPCKCETCTRKALRDVAKRVVYGLNYGAGAATVLGAIYSGGYSGPPITLQMVERTKNVFFRAFPGVPKWRDKMLKEAAVTREIRSPLLNRRRIFPLGDIDVTVVYNYPIQSGAADIMNQRLEILAEKLPSVDPSAKLIAQVHDAIYVECDEKLAEAVATLVQDSLSWTVALAEGALEMPFLATAAIAKNWKDAA